MILATTSIQITGALEYYEQFDKKKRTPQLNGQRFRTIWTCLQFGATLFDLHDVDMTALSSTTFLQAIGTCFSRLPVFFYIFLLISAYSPPFLFIFDLVAFLASINSRKEDLGSAKKAIRIALLFLLAKVGFTRHDDFSRRFLSIVSDFFELPLNELRSVQAQNDFLRRLDKDDCTITIWEFSYYFVMAIPEEASANIEASIVSPFKLIFTATSMRSFIVSSLYQNNISISFPFREFELKGPRCILVSQPLALEFVRHFLLIFFNFIVLFPILLVRECVCSRGWRRG